MQEIDDAIGRDKSTYRVAHLGISPAPSLMHGFYTVDGYSNNYSLEYKHRFREVIAAELEKMRKYGYTLTCGETGVIYSTVLPVIICN